MEIRNTVFITQSAATAKPIVERNVRRRLPARSWIALLCVGSAIWMAAPFSNLALAAESADIPPVSFVRDIAPILVQKCIQCHGEERPKGGYRLDQFKLLMQPGDSEMQPITPGSPDRSELYLRLTTSNEDDRMPQKDDPLTEDQIAAVKRWIGAGAAFDGVDNTAAIEIISARPPYPDPPDEYPQPVPILALAFRPDGVELAASGYHEVTFWNPDNGELLRRVKNLPERIQAIAFSPDGRYMAVAGGSPARSGEAVLVDLNTGVVKRVLARASDVFLAICFSPDAKTIAVGGADNAIRILDWATGKQEQFIQQHADWVMGLSFSPDGSRVASASRDRTARIYTTNNGELEMSYTEHNAPVSTVAFSSDGKQLVSGGRDQELHIWNASDAKKQAELRGFDGEIVRIVLTEGRVVSCGADRTVRLHDLKDRKQVGTFTGHDDWVYALTMDPAGKRLASGSHNGEVRIWSLESRNCLTTFLAKP